MSPASFHICVCCCSPRTFQTLSVGSYSPPEEKLYMGWVCRYAKSLSLSKTKDLCEVILKVNVTMRSRVRERRTSFLFSFSISSFTGRSLLAYSHSFMPFSFCAYFFLLVFSFTQMVQICSTERHRREVLSGGVCRWFYCGIPAQVRRREIPALNLPRLLHRHLLLPLRLSDICLSATEDFCP